MIRQIQYEEAGKEKLAEGIRKLCTILSTKGGILVNGSFSLSATTIAKAIEGEDLWVNQGIRLTQDAIAEINTKTGCGTKEAARMVLAMLSECQRMRASGQNPVLLSKKLKEAANQLVEKIPKLAVMSGKTKQELLQDISESEDLARLICQGLEQGELVIKESMYSETTLEVMHGMRLGGVPVVGKAASLTDVYVLVTTQIIDSFSELVPLLEKLNGRPLFIVAERIEKDALVLLKENVKKQCIQVWAMEAPYIGQRKRDGQEDLAALTGTEVYNPYYPTSLTELTPEMLGKAKKIEVTESDAILCGEQRSVKVQERIAKIQERIRDPQTNYYDQQRLRERIAGLSASAPTLYVGGDTLAEAKERKLRLEYAVAYAQTVEECGMIGKKEVMSVIGQTDGEKMIRSGLEKCFEDQEISAYLLMLLIKKVSGMLCMWLTTGAVMVSVAYDREDKELLKQGVDVERLRGTV